MVGLLRKRHHNLAVTPSPVTARAEAPKQSEGTASEAKRRPRSDKGKGRNSELAMTSLGVTARVSFSVTARVFPLCHCEERSDEAKVGGRISRRCEERSDEATS